MCGICAYIGFGNGYKHIYFGLSMLQNRGYDSAGICGINDSKLVVRKYASTEKTALEMLANMDNVFDGCHIIQAHSRWACQGAKTDLNAHPHVDFFGNFSIVHNGIIENYEEINNELIDKHNIYCKSQTDTEVIVNLISMYYNKVKNTELAIRLALDRLEGTWGLVIFNRLEPNRMYCARHGSPLLIGIEDNFAMVASEQSGFCAYIKNYICLNDNDIVILEKDYTNNSIKFHKKSEYITKKVTADCECITPKPYPHWTLKEIWEQPDTVKKAIGLGGRIINDSTVKLGGLEMQENLKDIKHLIILGCGTSYNAGMHVLHIFKKISGFETVQLFDGAEFNKYDIPQGKKTGFILLSQSGETRDLYQVLQIAKEFNIITIGIINVVDSLIAREVDCGIYLNAGKEVGVASTKVFTAQIIVLMLVAVWFSQIRNDKYIEIRRNIIRDIQQLPFDIKGTLDSCTDLCKNVAESLINENSCFILGKGSCESIAYEGALKIKEIGYIHAEGYSSSALKHGPYSLIRKGLPIIVVNPDDEYKINNKILIEEIKARDANIICITNNIIINKNVDTTILVKSNNTFNGILCLIAMQLIGYYLSCTKNKNPDLPNNLAKTVSVL